MSRYITATHLEKIKMLFKRVANRLDWCTNYKLLFYLIKMRIN